MPCLLAIFMIAFPRLALVLTYFLSNYLQRAYHTILWPLLGFIFMPLTTLAYAFTINSHGSLSGIYLIIVGVAVLSDLGLLGGGSHHARRA